MILFCFQMILYGFIWFHNVFVWFFLDVGRACSGPSRGWEEGGAEAETSLQKLVSRAQATLTSERPGLLVEENDVANLGRCKV